MTFAWLFLSVTVAPQIDLYTMGPGDVLFERFGHAALCVTRPENTDAVRCYNYGTTDFGSPPQELGWQFLRGKAKFWVSVWPLPAMLGAYRRADRDIFRQRLSLPPAQAEAIAAAVARDALQENRYYVYHHFRDNCSTRLRDLLDLNTGHSLSREDRLGAPSYRDLARRILPEQTGLLIVSDFALGRGADRPITDFDRMFLPHNLRNAVEDRLGAIPELVYRRRGTPLPVPGAIAPAGGEAGGCRREILGGSLLLGSLGALSSRFRRAGVWLQKLLLFFLGATGLVLWGMAIVSTVPELRWNEAALVFSPLDWAVLALRDPWRILYGRFRLVVLLSVSALLAAGMLVQPLFPLLLLPLGLFSGIAWPTSVPPTRLPPAQT